MQKVANLGFDIDFARRCIEANRHNNATTTYYLLLKRFVREGGISKTALGSKHFDPSLIEPPKRVKPSITSLSENSPPHDYNLAGEKHNSQSGGDFPKNLQANITRRNYMLHKQKM